MTTSDKDALRIFINERLDAAEATWRKFGPQMKNFSGDVVLANRKFANESVDSLVPGYPTVEQDDPQLDDFIAIVADMRDSTKHMNQACADADVEMLQRVFYETSGLIPTLSRSISLETGKVTEYLGDGVLGLFLASEEVREKAVYAAHRAAKDCIDSTKEILNPILKSRYKLPPLTIGVGLSFSEAIVSVVGADNHYEGKVFGKCVYNATKLSNGDNEVLTDDALKNIWPTEKGGPLKFISKELRNKAKGYVIYKG